MNATAMPSGTQKRGIFTPIVDAYWMDHCTLHVHRIYTRMAGATDRAVSTPAMENQSCCWAYSSAMVEIGIVSATSQHQLNLFRGHPPKF